MAQVLSTRHSETIYTVELTQRELNTICRLFRNLPRISYERHVINGFRNDSHFLSYEELSDVHKSLKDKRDYI